MAYVPNDPNQPQQNQQQNPMTQQAPITTSSAPGSGPSSGGKSSTAQANPAQPFTNLQAYLSANAPQIQSQANKISGDLTNQYGQVMQGLNQGAQDFGQQIAGGYAAPNADIVNQAGTNPAQFASNPDNVKAFQAQYNDTYGGPANYEGSDIYQTQNKAIQDAASKANLVNTLPGLQTYLQGQSPNQTQGENILDTTLLRGNPEALSQIQSAAKPFSTLQDYLSGQVTAQDQAVQNAINAANANRTAVQGQFTNTVIPGFQNTINQNVNTARTNAQNLTDQTKSDLISYLLGTQGGTRTPANVSPDEMKALGITPQDLQNYLNTQNYLGIDYSQNFDINPYIGSNLDPTAAINAANASSANDYATAAALKLLTGQDTGGILDQSNVSQAGTAPTNLFNPGSFQNAQKDELAQLQQNDANFLAQNQTPGLAGAIQNPMIAREIFGRNYDKLNPTQKWWYDNPVQGSKPPGANV